jgi:hypothetical protein
MFGKHKHLESELCETGAQGRAEVLERKLTGTVTRQIASPVPAGSSAS